MAASTKYNEELKKRVNHIFLHYVIPPNVLPQFRSCDILTTRDFENVKATTEHHGNIDGAQLLLDRLHKCENWFTCTLTVFRHSDVKLGHAAIEMEKVKADLDREYASQQASNNCVVSDEAPGKNCEDPPPAMKNGENSSSLSAEVNQSPSHDRVSESSNHKFKEEASKALARPNANTVKKQLIHGPEYDFQREEVSNALSTCPGWHSEMDEKMIWKLLGPLQKEKGHYILWYWERKKRPALCVTDDDTVKTLIVHKKPNKHNKTGKADYYFINKKQERKETLREIVDYHLQNGAQDMVANIFLHPVGRSDSA